MLFAARHEKYVLQLSKHHVIKRHSITSQYDVFFMSLAARQEKYVLQLSRYYVIKRYSFTSHV